MSNINNFDFITIMNDRGFIHQVTDKENLKKVIKRSSITGYIGFDCTAPSLHVGSLIQIMMLRWFQKTGNKPIVLMGGGTTKVGDPSGKDIARPLLSSEKIEKNKESIKTIFKKFLKFGDNVNDAIMVDNADWLENLNYISFLREYGSNNVKLMDWIPLTSTKSEKDLQPKKFRKKMVSVLGKIWFF